MPIPFEWHRCRALLKHQHFGATTLVNLIQHASQVVETVIHEIGHQMLEQILVLSAEQVAGARTPGNASGDIRYHGSQAGCVQLADRKVKVKKPRLRHKTEGEVKVPAYE